MAGGTLADILQQPVAAAVQIVHRDDVRTAVQHLQHGGRRGHTRGECESGRAALEIGDRRLKRVTCRIGRPRILVALVNARAGLNVGGRRINRRHHGARQRVRPLSTVDGPGGELLVARFGFHRFHTRRRNQLSRSIRVTNPMNSPSFTTMTTMPRLNISMSWATGASTGTVTSPLSMALVTGSLKCCGFSNTSSRISSSSTMPTIFPSCMTGSWDTS